jgi:RNA polymerase sigma-70 factor (ECF subfamily)
MASADLSTPESPTGELVFDPESVAWVEGLVGNGPAHDETVIRLHELLLRVARSEVRRRQDQLRITGPERDDLAHQAADDAVIGVTAKIAQFHGESKFTTWACKFAIFEVSTKIGRHSWQKPTISLGDEDWDRLPDRFGLDPAQIAEWRDVVVALRRAIKVELTEHQRRIFVAIVLDGMPLDALVIELGSSRNAIYKTLFDARRKLRASLVTNGYLDDDIVGQT